MPRTIIHVFGNPDIAMDSLPLRLLPELQKGFPDIEFRTLDPNEEWEIPDPFILIDTVVGIPDVHVFRSLDEFNASPTVSVHDFDALFNLRYLKKLGKFKDAIVVGIPPGRDENTVRAKLRKVLKDVLSASPTSS